MLSSAPYKTGQLRRPAIRIPTVCVVDPQADDYQGWDALAQAKGVKLQIVASAEEALRLARTQSVDLWVVNTELPRLSGIELCTMLKAQSAHTGVYLVADEYSAEAEHAAWRARATVFTYKPAHHALLDVWLNRHGGVKPPAHVRTTQGRTT